MQETGNKKFNAREKGLVALLLVAVALAVLFLVVTIIMVTGKGPGEPAADNTAQPSASNKIEIDANSEEGGLETKSPEEIQAELNEKVAQGMINISMNTSPIFKDGQAEGNLLIVNSEKNNYPQVVYIVRKDTQEEIYRSGAILVGSKIEKAPLAVDLDAGTYECVAYFNNVDLDTGEFLGTAGAEILITVES